MVKQKAIGAARLIPMVLNDQGLACQRRQEKWRERRPGEMNHVRRPNQRPESKKRGLSNYRKGKGGVVVIAGGSLRHQRDFKLARASGIAEFRESARQGKNDGFHSPDAGSKEMGIDEQFQAGPAACEFVLVADSFRDGFIPSTQIPAPLRTRLLSSTACMFSMQLTWHSLGSTFTKPAH